MKSSWTTLPEAAGTSTGIELATGRVVDVAVNHDPAAIRMHRTNHPYTRHYQESVWDIDPRKVCEGHPVGLAWFSPDCKHFSKAKGGKPVEKKIRGLAWVVMRWAGLCSSPGHYPGKCGGIPDLGAGSPGEAGEIPQG